jgi:hypothetical protein
MPSFVLVLVSLLVLRRNLVCRLLLILGFLTVRYTSGWLKSKTPKNVPTDVDDEPLTLSERAELKKLRKEQHVWEMEREILKKATAFFVKENGS